MAPNPPPGPEEIAVAGLARIASDDHLMGRFSALTGILPNEMRQAAAQPGFLAGVLDFYMAHEPDLLAWAQDAGWTPEAIVAARHKLAPHDHGGFE